MVTVSGMGTDFPLRDRKKRERKRKEEKNVRGERNRGCCGMFCHADTFCNYMVTKRAERSTRCIFCHPFASNTIIYLSLPTLCVCVRARTHVCLRVDARARVCLCVCGCAFVRSTARFCVCVVVYCVYYTRLTRRKTEMLCMCIYRLRGYCCP